MRSSRSEYSRYYGDFRGVDFSSDHTLVADSRFPYLVNMYKDYAAGGGQGIETIPGFRRLFVAPNGGRIHGIHSYKSKDGKRRVLVHAGKNLYKWDSFPSETGFAKEITATVKEYDEYSSNIEGVGISADYVAVEIVGLLGASIGGSVIDRAIADIRYISPIGSNKKISIYPKNLMGVADNSIYYAPYAYSFTQTDEDTIFKVTLKIAKKVQDKDGNVICEIGVGDTVNVGWYVFNADDDTEDSLYDYKDAQLTLQENASKTPREITLTYDVGNSSNFPSLPISYGWNDQYYTTLTTEDLPEGFKNIPELVSSAIRITGEKTFAIVPYGTKPSLKVFYDGNEELDEIDLEKCYQVAADGSRVTLPEAAKTGIKFKLAEYRTPISYEATTFTAVEFDEYEAEGKRDRTYIDISAAQALGIQSVRIEGGANDISDTEYQREGNLLLFNKKTVGVGSSVIVTFGETSAVSIRDGMNERDSTSFIFGDKLYILDGNQYLVYDGEKISNVADNAYVPTTRINIVPGGENADAGKENEPRNILSPYFKNTFIPDGESTEYYISESGIEKVEKVTVYGEELQNGKDYHVAPETGKITFENAPERSEAKEGYPENYAGVEVTAKKRTYPAIDADDEMSVDNFRSTINQATLATVFDNRVFFSGIPSKPNAIFWSNLRDPSYIGILNYQQDGVGTSPITAMIPVANTLLVLKGDTEDGGSVFYHTPLETGIDVMTKSYPFEEGIAGIGCLGAACNFLDDPVFVSRLGLEAIGKMNLSYERSKEHRSSLIDAKLVNLKNLASAKLCEWGGYLVLLVDGRIFLADSRQRYADQAGVMQYEWYYLEDIGVFDRQYQRYEYLRKFPELLMVGDERRNVKVEYQGIEYSVGLITDILPDIELIEVSDKTDKVIPKVNIGGIEFDIVVAMYNQDGQYYACLCDTDDEMIGGEFSPAVVIKTIDDNLYFGTSNGVICAFNFDKRNEDGSIPPEYYTFDGRRIYSGCALKMDNCGIPHMTKTTVKKSTVVKVKSFLRTAAKLRVRTNKNPFNEIARINGTRFSFDDMDFSDFSFVVGDDTLFSVREKEKKWVEKQYYLYSDEYKKPFALYYLAYRYFVAGKYKG